MDDLPPEIAALVEQKRRADEPSAEDQVRVGKSLATALGLPNTGWIGAEGADVAASHSASATATGAVMSTGVKAALVAAVVVAGASAVFVWRGNGPAPDSRVQSMRGASAAGAEARAPFEPARSTSATSARRALEPASDSRANSARPEITETLDTPTAVPVQPVQSVSRPNRAPTYARKQGDAQPTAPQLGSPPLAAEVDAPERGSSERAASSAAQSEAVLEGELALMAAASEALDNGDATAAMKELETHRSRFGTGFLSQERDALWIVALCKQGRAEEAAAARATFERRAPRSPLRVRIEKQCGKLGKP
jgi:hypothetical protein